MKVIPVKNYKEMSTQAAEIFLSLVKNNPKAVVGLATGSTPIGLYKNIIEDHQQRGTSYQQITSFNLDEYIGLDGSHPQSYQYFMNEHLFNDIDIPKENTFIPSGKAEDIDVECKKFETLIQEHGGIDLQILGVGRNGHIGFNEPGTAFDSRTHMIELTEETRQDNARFFTSIEEVPTHAVTMGIQTILESKQIILLVSGAAKSEALTRLLSDEEPNEDFPVSSLKNHPDFIVIADEEALNG